MAQAWSLDRLKNLRAQALADVEAFDRVIARLNAKNGHDPAALETLPAKLAAAIDARNGNEHRQRGRNDGRSARIAGARQEMMTKVLAAFSTKAPRTFADVRDDLPDGGRLGGIIGTSIRLGLLKHVGQPRKYGPLLRTDKPYPLVTGDSASPKRKVGKLSAAGRRAISRAQKKRWREQKARQQSAGA